MLQSVLVDVCLSSDSNIRAKLNRATTSLGDGMEVFVRDHDSVFRGDECKERETQEDFDGFLLRALGVAQVVVARLKVWTQLLLFALSNLNASRNRVHDALLSLIRLRTHAHEWKFDLRRTYCCIYMADACLV
jgi:hypothetical protein